MDRKKELKALYKQMKPDMGILIIRPSGGDKCYIEETRDLNGRINRTKFQLKSGSHPNRELQRDWQALGESRFIIDILERLDYDKDESKTDYTEDLQLLKEIWEERLTKENMRFYKK